MRYTILNSFNRLKISLTLEEAINYAKTLPEKAFGKTSNARQLMTKVRKELKDMCLLSDETMGWVVLNLLFDIRILVKPNYNHYLVTLYL